MSSKGWIKTNLSSREVNVAYTLYTSFWNIRESWYSYFFISLLRFSLKEGSPVPWPQALNQEKHTRFSIFFSVLRYLSSILNNQTSPDQLFSFDFISLHMECSFLPVYLSCSFCCHITSINSHPHLMLGHLHSLQNLKVLLVLWKERELIAFVPVKKCVWPWRPCLKHLDGKTLSSAKSCLICGSISGQRAISHY